MKRYFWLTTTVIFAGISAVLGLYYFNHNHNAHTIPDRYPLLAKRLFQENPNDTIINFSPLRAEVKQYLGDTNIPHSFYFEYLPTGSNIRDGESNELVGASLMKIPLVMDLYKAAEDGKINLDQQYTIEQSNINNDSEYGDPSHYKVGDKITLREAAKKTLQESNNTTSEVINAAIKDKIPADEQAIQNLDVTITSKTGLSGKFVLIGARPYSSFLKCLYFSCFLSKEDSEEILTYLTQTTSTDRLASGAPKEVNFAHKIGSFSKFTQSDCGIVYVPNRQYIICLMFQAPEDQADPHFKKVSEMVYKYVTGAN